MNLQAAAFEPLSAGIETFDMAARKAFAHHYPENPHTLRHSLGEHTLLELGALAELAERLPQPSVEYNRGDVPIGVDSKPEATGLSIGETIRKVAQSNSWAVLKSVEQVPTYKALLDDLLGEISAEIAAKTGAILTPQAYIFISSPNAVTPYHFDPEHNILLQVRGTKIMTQFPAGNPLYAADAVHESYHTGGPRELQWKDDFLNGATDYSLGPGDAVYVPVMAPHFVRNGPQSSVSLSITWRSSWSYNESDARAFNGVMRRFGLNPKAPGRWPNPNRAKSLGYRALRKVGLAPA